MNLSKTESNAMTLRQDNADVLITYNQFPPVQIKNTAMLRQYAMHVTDTISKRVSATHKHLNKLTRNKMLSIIPSDQLIINQENS